MKNAQLKLTEVDDDELWLAVRLAHCGSSSSGSSNSSSSNRVKTNRRPRTNEREKENQEHQQKIRNM